MKPYPCESLGLASQPMDLHGSLSSSTVSAGLSASRCYLQPRRDTKNNHNANGHKRRCVAGSRFALACKYCLLKLAEAGGFEPLPCYRYPGVQALLASTTPATSSRPFSTGASLHAIEPSGTSQILVGVVRLELTTSRLKAGCSALLSYTPLLLEPSQRVELCSVVYKTAASPTMLAQLVGPEGIEPVVKVL